MKTFGAFTGRQPRESINLPRHYQVGKCLLLAISFLEILDRNYFPIFVSICCLVAGSVQPKAHATTLLEPATPSACRIVVSMPSDSPPTKAYVRYVFRAIAS